MRLLVLMCTVLLLPLASAGQVHEFNAAGPALGGGAAEYGVERAYLITGNLNLVYPHGDCESAEAGVPSLSYSLHGVPAGEITERHYAVSIAGTTTEFQNVESTAGGKGYRFGVEFVVALVDEAYPKLAAASGAYRGTLELTFPAATEQTYSEVTTFWGSLYGEQTLQGGANISAVVTIVGAVSSVYSTC